MEEKGENARLSSFVGAMAIADLVRTTLGPKVRTRPTSARAARRRSPHIPMSQCPNVPMSQCPNVPMSQYSYVRMSKSHSHSHSHSRSPSRFLLQGMDKILQSVSKGSQVTVTNDGATILKSIYVDNPAAKVLIDISKVQDDEVGVLVVGTGSASDEF